MQTESPLPLANKTALVTGGSRGIGRAIALRLARDGAKVVINYVSQPEAATSLVAEIEASGGVARAHRADLADLDQIPALVAAASAISGTIDILVNNAGRRVDVHPLLEEATVAEFDHVYALNTRAVFFLTQAVVRAMPDHGRVVNISSASTTRRMPRLSMYAGSKAAVDVFTRIWSVELAARGITVNAILPGAVETDLLHHNRAGTDTIAKMLAMIPMGRLGQPGDIADAVALLVREDARWITGQIILATGGA